jgi:hypothetical protein
VLKELYPFIPVSSLEDVMEDIHEEKNLKLKSFVLPEKKT